MRILFLCGSLEQGSDGVGDYARRLAAELILQNHATAIIALNDWKIQQEFDGLQYESGTAIKVLRLPAGWAYKKKLTVAAKWTDSFAPQWISLQYVPFSFNAKGLPFGLSNFLKNLNANSGRKWHIMFHELWVVSRSLFPNKMLATGVLQKLVIRQLVKKLKSPVAHTQTRLYQQYLRRLQINATYLPLFSNIAVLHSKRPFINHSSNGNNKISVVSFGSIYPNALIEAFANEVALYTKKNELDAVLIIIGRAGNLQEHWTEVWKAAGLKVEQLGEQPAEKISEVFSGATIGISSTPYPMVEKSGAVAAMREHGLPVACIADPWIPKNYNPTTPNDILEYSKGNFEEWFNSSSTIHYHNNVSIVARQFISDLQAK